MSALGCRWQKLDRTDPWHRTQSLALFRLGKDTKVLLCPWSRAKARVDLPTQVHPFTCSPEPICTISGHGHLWDTARNLRPQEEQVGPQLRSHLSWA